MPEKKSLTTCKQKILKIKAYTTILSYLYNLVIILWVNDILVAMQLPSLETIE
jgi:hypothetical protein